MTTKYQQRKEEILAEFEKKYGKVEEYSHADGAYEPAIPYLKSFLSTAIDQIAKEVVEVAEVEKKDIPTNEIRDIVLALKPNLSVEDRAEIRRRDDKLWVRHYECAVHNAAITQSHQQLKEYFSGTDILLEDKEKGI